MQNLNFCLKIQFWWNLLQHWIWIFPPKKWLLRTWFLNKNWDFATVCLVLRALLLPWFAVRLQHPPTFCDICVFRGKIDQVQHDNVVIHANVFHMLREKILSIVFEKCRKCLNMNFMTFLAWKFKNSKDNFSTELSYETFLLIFKQFQKLWFSDFSIQNLLGQTVNNLFMMYQN